jgi:hypothetical protein
MSVLVENNSIYVERLQGVTFVLSSGTVIIIEQGVSE